MFGLESFDLRHLIIIKEWNLAPYWGWDYILFSLWTIFTSSSGMLIIDEKGFIEILSMAAIL